MPDSFPFLQHLDVPPPWEEAARRFLTAPGVTLVLGGPDAGKSTLCSYLVYRAYATGEPAALLDLDLGQSHLGPPGALGLGLFPPRFPGDRGLFPEALYFIGQTSPVGALLEVAVGCRVLADEARARGINRLVVNTSGLVRGLAAHRLKQAQVELLKPRIILALDREGELVPLLRTLDPHRSRTMTLPVSARALRRGFEERRLYREGRFRLYLAKARPLDLALDDLVWQGPPLGWGDPLPPAELSRWSTILGAPVLSGAAGNSRLTLLLEHSPSSPPSPEAPERVHLLYPANLEHHLVGLWDARRRTLALGVLLPSPWQERTLRVMTPLPPARLQEVKFLSLGRVRLSLSGRELTAGDPPA